MKTTTGVSHEKLLLHLVSWFLAWFGPTRPMNVTDTFQNGKEIPTQRTQWFGLL